MRPQFIAIDVETTGLDPLKHEIISLAAYLLSPQLEVVSNKTMYAFPDKEVDPVAAQINGYTEDAWRLKGAVNQATLAADFYDFVKPHEKLVPLGHNVGFDMKFVSALLTGKRTNFDYHLMDTAAIAQFMDIARHGKLSTSYKLVDLCSRFNIALAQAHDATSDILATIELFKMFLNNFENRAPLPEPIIYSKLMAKTAAGWEYVRGKHKGKKIVDVFKEDPTYIQWTLSLDDLSGEQRDYLSNLS